MGRSNFVQALNSLINLGGSTLEHYQVWRLSDVPVSLFLQIQIFTKDAQIQISEIFVVLIFKVDESGTCVLGLCTAKS